MLTHLLYHKSGTESATRLAAFLGIAAATAFDKHGAQRPDFLIRWGSAHPVPLKAGFVFNSAPALNRQRNRLDHIGLLRAAQLPAPHAFQVKEPGGQFTHAVIGRSLKAGDGSQTSKGQGMVLYQPGEIVGKHDFFVYYIDKQAEFRVDVVGHHTRVRQLKAKDPKALAWNADGVFDKPLSEPAALRPLAVAAVKALSLDFGAVDLVQAKGGGVSILEVNTAPELTDPTLEWYAGQFARVAQIDKFPGWQAVPKKGA